MSEQTKDWYKRYLQTDHFACVRRRKLQWENYTCQKCKRKSSYGNYLELHIHHLNYNCLYHENMHLDIQCLCKQCHAAEHNIEDAPVPSDSELKNRINAFFASAPPLADAETSTFDERFNIFIKEIKN